MNKKITITLSDGVSRDFQFNFGVLKRLGKLPGDPLEDVPLWDLIWAGLSKEERQNLTVEDVADLIPMDQTFLKNLTQSIAESFPKVDPDPNAQPAQPSN